MVIHYHRFIVYLLLLVLGSTITKIQRRLSRLVSLITIIVQIELVAHVERGKYIGRYNIEAFILHSVYLKHIFRVNVLGLL